MDDITELFPPSNDAKCLDVPYEQRWEHLKPVIVKLYMGKYGPNGKSMTTPQVADFMKVQYSFHAAVSQYRYHFKQWDVRKRIFKREKDDIVAALGRRSHPGTSTSNVTLGLDKGIDKKQLKRYLSGEIRHHTTVQMLPGVLTSFNLPYAAYVKALGNRNDHSSPFGENGATPSYMKIDDPKTPTPGRAAAIPSPSMQLTRQKLAHDRASLFLQGHHIELLSSCGKEDRTTITNYFHDFYLFTFVVAKYWGCGPRMTEWTPNMVARMTTGARDGVSPASPSNVASPLHRERAERLEAPTQLCRWCIHVTEVKYTPVPDANVDNIREYDDVNPSSFSEWSSAEHFASIPLADWMQDSIKQGTFSATLPENLPISTEALSLSLQQDPELVRVDAWKVAIMAGNVDLIWKMGLDTKGRPSGIDDIHPMHLAASHLDGGHTCCDTLTTLSEILGYEYVFFHQRDQLGHTVLDTLMVNILRSHTTVTPEQVNPHFNPPHRFPGEEKDICGRWDADSPELRALFQHGYARVPTKWKHAFCHSSAQAICHSILVVIGSPASPPVDALSGLFVRRCTEPDCGQELKLGPLHVAVAVAFYLAHRGMNGETLFGALAVIVCLQRLGADTSLKVEVSVPALLGQSEPGGCSHHPMSAYELMQAVPQEIVSTWTLECQEGWACISQVLLLSDSPKQDGPSEGDDTFDNGDALMDDDIFDDGDTSMGDHDTPENGGCRWHSEIDFELDVALHDEWLRLPCGSPKLGLLWATIQVELLTYRRIKLRDPWVSKNFSMAALGAWLDGKASEFHTPLTTENRLKKHTCCGWFNWAADFVMPIAEEVCTEHFMNMEDYERASFTPRPQLCDDWLQVLPPKE